VSEIKTDTYSVLDWYRDPTAAGQCFKPGEGRAIVTVRSQRRYTVYDVALSSTPEQEYADGTVAFPDAKMIGRGSVPETAQAGGRRRRQLF
jgi:hypothetical protein